MKLLFDENVSSELVAILAAEFPGSAHIREIGLRGAEDRKIWDHARTHGFFLVSKDTDFREFSRRTLHHHRRTTAAAAVSD